MQKSLDREYQVCTEHCGSSGFRADLKDPRYDRMAKSLIYFSMIIFSLGAALGTGIPIFIIGTYPEFWSRWSNLFFWSLMAQFVFFLGEVAFLFFGYYLPWDRMVDRKRLHLGFGILLDRGRWVGIIWMSLVELWPFDSWQVPFHQFCQKRAGKGMDSMGINMKSFHISGRLRG